MPGIRRGLFFGGTEAVDSTPAQTPNEAVDDDSAENSDGDVPFVRHGIPGKKKGGTNGRVLGAGCNSDDARLIELKMQGYSDTAIRDKLLEEGRVKYAVATIGTRFRKLKNAAEEEENDRLDDELSDWHIGEDDILQDIVKDMDQRYELEHQKLEDKKWKEISEVMAGRLDVKKYTGTACQDRWNALQDGTALKPIELDSDQEGRRLMREQRVSTNKKRRADAKAAAWAKKKAAEGKRVAMQENSIVLAQHKAEARRIKEADQAETKRLQEERRLGRERERAGLEEAKQLWMAVIQEKRRIRQMEERVYRNLTGKQLNRMRRVATFEDEEEEEEEESENIPLDFTNDDEDEEGYVTDAELNADLESENNPDSMEGITSDREEDVCASSDSGVASKASPSPPTQAKVTPETLANPRSVLTDAELEVLLFERGLPRRTKRESHPHVVARLAAADEALNVASVTALLEKYFDRAKGTKSEKVRRLAQHDADKSAAGGQGINSTDLAFKKGYEGYQGKFAGLIR